MIYRRFLLHFALLFILSAIAVSQNRGEKQTYTVADKLKLSVAANGVDGTLQLLVDQRLTESVRQELWGKGAWSFVFKPDTKLYREFSALPPGKSKLMIRDNTEKVLANRDLETPLAKLKVWNRISDTNQFFLLIEDYTAGAGSYNGPKATLLQITNATFHDVKALNTQSHQEEPIRLVKSLKADWRQENIAEILSVSCYENGDGRFVVDYIRYNFDGNRWLEYKRESEGFWESDQPFPLRAAFP